MNTEASIMDGGGLRDIQPPVEISASPLGFWISLTLGLILLVVGVVVFRRWRQRQRSVPSELSAGDQARRMLEDLTQNTLSADLTQFYEQLTRVIRVFLGVVTGVPSDDKTTSELDEWLRQPQLGLSGEDAAQVLAILRRGDDVKFAKAGVTPEQRQDDVRVITAWVTRDGKQA